VNVASFCAVRFGLSLQLAPMLASDAKTILLKVDLVQDGLPFTGSVPSLITKSSIASVFRGSFSGPPQIVVAGGIESG